MIFATAAPFARLVWLTALDLATPIHTDNEQNRKALIFARVLCRPHMNASTWSFPPIC